MRSTFNVNPLIESTVKNFNNDVWQFAKELAVTLGVPDENQIRVLYDRNGFTEKVIIPKDFSGRPKVIEVSPNTNGMFDCLLSCEDTSSVKEFKEQTIETFWIDGKHGALHATLEFFGLS